MQCTQFAQRLEESVARNQTDALLLSGGLDSAILASHCRPAYAVTVALGLSAPDIEYARQVAQRFCEHHIVKVLDEHEVLDVMERVIVTLKTFDPIAIRNSVVALAGLEQAKRDGYSVIMSGDGCDELFAGYNFLSRYYADLLRLNQELERLWKIMHFTSDVLASSLSMQMKCPFLDQEFVSYAKSIPVEEKLGLHNGKQWGKFILRRCYEGPLRRIAWREKAAQETGAGIWKMTDYLERNLDPSTFQLIQRNATVEGVILRDIEHAYYYSIFRKYYLPPKEGGFQNRCPACGGNFPDETRRFCRICGAYPVSPLRSP